MPKKKEADSKKIRVNFGGVDKEIRGKSERSARVPEGDYVLKIVDANPQNNEDTGSKGINWKFQIAEGKYRGKTLYGYTSLKKEALWNLRNLIHAATGRNVAGKTLDFDFEKLFGKLVGSTVEDDEYTNKNNKTVIKSKPNSFFPKDEVESTEDEDEDEDEEEDEEDDDEDEDEDEEEDEDLEEVDVESL